MAIAHFCQPFCTERQKCKRHGDMLCRVYARLSPDSIIRELEEAATQAALITIALSRSDADYIAQHYLPGNTQASSRPHVSRHHPLLIPACAHYLRATVFRGQDADDSHTDLRADVQVLLPALRKDMERVPLPAAVKGARLRRVFPLLPPESPRVAMPRTGGV